MSADKNTQKEGERKISEVPGREEKETPRKQNWFREMAQKLGPLVAGAFLAVAPANVGCGSANSDTAEDDAGAEVGEEDVAADVQPDEPDAQEDSAIPDMGEDSIGPDVPDVIAEDVQEDVAVDVEDVTDEPESLDEGVDVPPEADVPRCEPVERIEERAPEPAGTICGSTREKVVSVRITEYGEGCETVGTETSLESIEYRIDPPIDYSGERDPLGGLVCARGNQTELLNPGTYVIIHFSPLEIQAGYQLAYGLNMTARSPPLNGGDYQLAPGSVDRTLKTLDNLLDAAGTFLYQVLVPGQGTGGYLTIDPNNGALAWDLVPGSASRAMIRLQSGNPVVIENPGSIYYEAPGDEGWFQTRILTGSSYWEITGYRFDRDHYKK